MSATKLLLVCLAGWLAVSCGPTGATFSISREYTVVERATYLRTEQDNPVNAVVIDLTELGISAGFTLELESNGQYFRNSSNEASTAVGGVFSSSHTLYPADSAHRIPGAIDAGGEVTTAPTLYDDLSTDIPEDFKILENGNTVSVPDGAKFLFLGVHDDYMADNTESPGRFTVKVTW